MKGWRIFILLALASAVASTSRNTLRRGLLKVFTKWRNNDVSSLPFPLASPRNIYLGSQERKYNGYTLSLDGAVLQGLESLTVERLSVSDNGLTASLAINIPELKITADYYTLEKSWWFSEYGGGFCTTIDDFGVTADVAFSTDGTNTVIENLTMNYSFGAISADLKNTNFIVEGKYKKNLKKYLSEKKSALIEEATTLIKSKVNRMLRGYTPAQLINIIRDI